MSEDAENKFSEEGIALSELEEMAVADASEDEDTELKNYLVVIESGDGSKTHVLVDNSTSASTAVKDLETQEVVQFMFALFTTLDEEGDSLLASMSADMDRAGVHHHTYDAKSGALYRITRVGATQSRLEIYAEATKFYQRLKKSEIKAACHQKGLVLGNPTYGKLWYHPYEHLSAPFQSELSNLYEPFSEGQKVKLLAMLCEGDSHIHGPGKGCGFNIVDLNTRTKDNKHCLAFFPLHQSQKSDKLYNAWMPNDWPWKLPINDIAEYFGEEIGFYFAFLGHLTTGNFILAPLGIAAQVISVYSLFYHTGWAGQSEAWYGAVSFIGYCLTLDKWKCEQSRIAHLWSTFDALKRLPTRPGFDGYVLKNPVTGKIEVEFPEEFRTSRSRASFFLSSTVLVCLLGTIVGIFAYKYILEKSGASSTMMLLPAVLNAVQITVFGIVYEFIGTKLTDHENHRTVSAHNSALFSKLSIFYFINNFATLFYIAFIKPLDGQGCTNAINDSTSCGAELSVQVAMVFIINDSLSRIKRSLVDPAARSIFKRYYVAYISNSDFRGADMGPIEKQYRLMGKYDPTKELIKDYIELYIQWGYLALFGAAFPLGSVLAAITNYIETRTDGRKLFKDFRRTLPNPVDGIGEALDAFRFTLYLAIVVNAALFVFTFRAFEQVLPNVRNLYVFVALALVLIMLMRQLDGVYPDVPKKTQVQVERERVIYTQIIIEEESPDIIAANLDESMLGISLDRVREILAAKAKLNKTKVTRTDLPPDYDMSQLGDMQPVNFAAGGSERRIALEAQVAKAVNDLAENTKKALEATAARKLSAHGKKSAMEAATSTETAIRMAAEEHASFYSLAAETALAESRGVASNRRKFLELAVARAVTELAEATAEDVERANLWDGSAEAAAASATEQASFFSLAADIARTEATKATTRTRQSIPYATTMSDSTPKNSRQGI